MITCRSCFSLLVVLAVFRCNGQNGKNASKSFKLISILLKCLNSSVSCGFHAHQSAAIWSDFCLSGRVSHIKSLKRICTRYTRKWQFINNNNKTAPENLYSTQIMMSAIKCRRPVKFLFYVTNARLTWSESVSLYLRQYNKHLTKIPTRWIEVLHVHIVINSLHSHWRHNWTLGNPGIGFEKRLKSFPQRSSSRWQHRNTHSSFLYFHLIVTVIPYTHTFSFPSKKRKELEMEINHAACSVYSDFTQDVQGIKDLKLHKPMKPVCVTISQVSAF